MSVDCAAMNARIAQLNRDNAPLSLYYQADGVTIYHDDTGRVLHALGDGSIGGIITDPTYTNYEYLIGLSEGAWPYDPAVDGKWITALLTWYCKWVPNAARVTGRGPAWVFLHADYAQFFWRIACVAHWPPSVGLDIDRLERLLGMGPVTPIETVEGNTYGSDKAVSMLRPLVRAIPRSDKPLLDPFMGNGSTLVAGRLEGWAVCGVDSDEACCERAAKALEAGA